MTYRSTARELGPTERTFGSPAPVRQLAIVWAIFGLPAIALVTGFQSAPGEVFAGDRTTNTLVGGGLLAIALWASVALVRKAAMRVELHTGGLRWRERGLTRDIAWEEIAELRGVHTARTVAGAEVARTSVYRLVLEGGTEYVMTNMLSDLGALAARIEAELARRRLPLLRARLERGERVAFGPVALGPDGVTSGDRTIAWAALAGVDVEGGVVRVHGPILIEVRWSAVPNAALLLALLEERRAVLS